MSCADLVVWGPQTKEEKRKNKCHYTLGLRQDILDVFDVDTRTSKDVCKVNPNKICTKCRNVTLNFRKDPTSPFYRKNRLNAKDNDCMWTHFSGEILKDDCKVCSRFHLLSTLKPKQMKKLFEVGKSRDPRHELKIWPSLSQHLFWQGERTSIHCIH